MSVSVSDRLSRVRPSATAAMFARAKALQAEGRDIVSLAAGEPDFDTPDHIKSAAIKAIRGGETKYTPTDGSAALKDAVVSKFRNENGLEYTPRQILVSCGAKQSIFNACVALLGPGDEAVIPAPYWVSYPDMVRLCDAEPVIVDTTLESGFKLDPSALRDALSSKTRVLILNSPSNPCGSAYTASEFHALGEVLADFPDVVVISDEIYEHIYWADEPFTSFAKAAGTLYDRTVTVNGVSKAYAMTGWRIGYAAGPAEVIDAMKTVQSQSTSNPCSISQAAAAAALTGSRDAVADMVRHYKSRHDLVVEALNSIPGFECRRGEGTFYAFPRIEAALKQLGLSSDTEFAESLIETGGVAVVPGSAFGAPGHLRLSFASSEAELTDALERLKRAVSA